MTVKKGDTVIWRGRRAKVLDARRESGLVLSAGEGQIVRDVGVRDYTELPSPEPEPAAPVSIKKPVRAKPRIANASRQRSTGKGK